MKAVAVLLSVLFILLQVRLWFGDGSVSQVFKLKQAVAEQHAIVEDLSKRNQMQDAEVQDLKLRMGALEERARNDLGMIHKGETFFQYDARITEAESKRASAHLEATAQTPVQEIAPNATTPSEKTRVNSASVSANNLETIVDSSKAPNATSVKNEISAKTPISVPDEVTADEQIKD